MPSLTRSSRSRSLSNRSRRASYRDAAQQTSESRNSSPRRRRPASAHDHRPHRTPSPSPTRPSATHPDRKRFGLHVHDNQQKIGKFDFEEKYAEDPIYEELGPNARVWRVNLDECEVFDNDMVVEARDGLDLLLVFAGLFSAVLTTFVTQTSQALSNNFPAVSTSLLLEMVTLQRALINGTPIDDISSSEMTSGPSGFDVWVNALWFTSLTLSLGTALMAVLVKQWLYQYMSFTSGTARDRSLIRFYRFDGLRKWRVLTIIGTLPIVLHVALGSFLAGLVVFLIPLNIPLASVVGSITVVIYIMYTVSNILPIIYTQCPYRTPFSDILNTVIRSTSILFTSVTSLAVLIYRLLLISISNILVAREETSTISISSDSSKRVHPGQGTVVFPTLKDAERVAATSDEVAEGIAANALVWLHQRTSNPPTKSIVLQSLGCLSDNVSDRMATINSDLKQALEEVIHGRKHASGNFDLWSILPGQESRAERLLRAQRHIKEPQTRCPWWEADAEAFKPPFHILAAILTYVPAISVKSRGGEPRDWYSKDLFMHIIQQYSAGRPIHLPSTLWQQFMPMDLEDKNLKLSLCRLALESWGNTERTPPPFSGAVLITQDTVPLKQVIRSMPQNDLPGSEPLHGPCILNDYIISELSTNGNLVTDDAISTLVDIWNRIPYSDDRTSGDSAAVRRHAEKCILEVFIGDWWDGQSNRRTVLLLQCYMSVVRHYWLNCGPDSVPSVKLFTKLFPEFCWSEMVADTSGYNISPILEYAFSLDVDSTTAYYPFFCGLESPLFSPRTKLSLHHATKLCPVIAAFVSGLARGSHPPALSQQCMEFLCEEPDRLFTVCRILALETDRRTPSRPDNEDDRRGRVREELHKLVRLDPHRAAWEDRTHHIIGIEPWDWPYFVIRKDDGDIGDARDRMQFALKVLDDFFSCASENHPNRPSTSPPSGPQTRPIIGESYMDSQPPTVVSPWRRVRQLVFSARAFGRSSSSPVDIELAGPSNDRPSRTSASESRHTTARIEPANATAGPSLLPAPAVDDSMV